MIDPSNRPKLVAFNSWGEINCRNRAVVSGWMGYAEVAAATLATWVASKIANN
jgi:hypothetical protein